MGAVHRIWRIWDEGWRDGGGRAEGRLLLLGSMKVCFFSFGWFLGVVEGRGGQDYEGYVCCDVWLAE